ncbi:LptF/LptG family permease [bacterium]|nr:LptF/LptG family permease [bacterium]
MKIIDRYIMSEMISPFLFGVCTFTLLFVSADTLLGVAKVLMESESGVKLLLEYLVNRLPFVLILTFPMSVLLSALMAYGRISGESELVALKAGGVGFFRVFVPGLCFCAIVAVIALIINDALVPPTMRHCYDMMLKVKPDTEIQRAVITSPRLLDNGEEQMVYAHKLNVKEGSMQGVFIHYFWDNRRLREIYADEARWNGHAWAVKGLRFTDFAKDGGNVRYEGSGGEAWSTLSAKDSPPDPTQLARRKLRPEEMTRKELAAYLKSVPKYTKDNPEAFRKNNKYAVQFYQKISLPVTCLVFGAFAIPLSLRPQRTSTSIGFGLSLLLILLYYILMTVGQTLGEGGKIAPWLAAWIPNIVFGIVGAYLVFDASRK